MEKNGTWSGQQFGERKSDSAYSEIGQGEKKIKEGKMRGTTWSGRKCIEIAFESVFALRRNGPEKRRTKDRYERKIWQAETV